jgi:hypothetical protein
VKLWRIWAPVSWDLLLMGAKLVQFPPFANSPIAWEKFGAPLKNGASLEPS